MSTTPRYRRLLPHALKLSVPLLVLAVLLCFGIQTARYKIDLIRDIQFVGHADEAGYVAMGQSLAEGRGLEVDYVSWHFIPYPRTITHREDHWPPFLGFAIAPFFYFLGQEPWVSKLAPIFLGSLGLPLATAALGMVYSRRAYVGLIAGLLMLLNMKMFTESMKTLSDVPVAVLVTAFCAALVAARYRPWMHLVAGVLAALAYYAKGSELVLLLVYPLATVLICGVHTPWKRLLWLAVAAVVPVSAGLWVVRGQLAGLELSGWFWGAAGLAAVLALATIFAERRAWMWAGLATALLLISPWFYSNYRLYGNPLHSTQNFVSGYIGLNRGLGGDPWESGTYLPYLGRDLPKTSDRWTKYQDRYWTLFAENREYFTRCAILGSSTGRNQLSEGPEIWSELGQAGLRAYAFLKGDTAATRYLRRGTWKPVSQWKEPLCAVPGVAAVGFVGVLILLTPLGMLAVWAWRKRHSPSPEHAGASAAKVPVNAPWLLGPTLALVLIMGVQWLFLVAFWEWAWMSRLSFVFLPTMAVLGCTGLSRLVELPIGGLLGLWQVAAPHRFPRLFYYWHVPVSLALTALVFLVGISGALAQRLDDTVAQQRGLGYPYADNLYAVRMGQFIKARYPNAVFMSRYPWQIRFYCAKTNKGVNVPLAEADAIFAVARYYGVSLYVHDGIRPSMEPYVRGILPGLRWVSGGPEGKLYEIQWDQLPRATGELPESRISTAMR